VLTQPPRRASTSALCEYDRLFGEVKRVAAEQRIVLTSKVRELGVTRLEGVRAVVLAFVDQTSTRGDQGTSSATGAQLGFQADRQDGRWKITRFDLFNQPLPAGGTGSQC
jgi:Mce-associated membrane protein